LSIASTKTIISVLITNGAFDDWVGVDNISFTNVSAVPEPTTYAMFVPGLGLLGFMGRKRTA
jgi:hypothetical protein